THHATFLQPHDADRGGFEGGRPCPISIRAFPPTSNNSTSVVPDNDEGAPSTASRLTKDDRAFPTLTQVHVDRIAKYGRRRPTSSGEVLYEIGDKPIPMFVIVTGELELIRHSAPSGVVALTLGPGNFTGEANVLTGRPALLLLRVAKSGEVIEIARERLLELIQADAELS